MNAPVSNIPITETGIKGFLMWFAREQPALYAKIAPKLPSSVPKAFSGFNDRENRRKFFGSLGDDSIDLSSFDSSIDPTSIDLSAISPIDFGPSIDLSSDINAPIDTGQIDTPSVQPIFDPSTGTFSTPSPVAQAANSGVAGTPTAMAIGQVIGAASQVLLTNQQAALQQSVVNTQLQRAAAGLPPLNTSLNQLGIPTIATSGTLGNSGTIFLILGALGLVALLGGKKGEL